VKTSSYSWLKSTWIQFKDDPILYMKLTMFLTSHQCTQKKIKDALGTIKKLKKVWIITIEELQVQ